MQCNNNSTRAQNAPRSAPVAIVLVGIGGYGGTAVRTLLDNPRRRDWRLAGVVDPFAPNSTHFKRLQAMRLPFYDSLEEFFSENQADLAIVSSPIQHHCQQACSALANRCHVLCEKPACATLAQCLRMQAAEDASGHFLALGYQWSHSPAILELKNDIAAGLFGAARRLRCLVLWPRSDSYYRRNSWAGALKSADGAWILDSPANNACAHYLHNMLFVLGEQPGQSASLQSLQAELYRANDISNYDSIAMRAVSTQGCEMLFYASHAVSKLQGPIFSYEFDKGRVEFAPKGSILATFADGRRKDYGSPDEDNCRKYWDAIAAVKGEYEPPCRIAAASAQVLCVNAAYDSCRRQIVRFPPRDIYKMGPSGNQISVMSGLAQAFEESYQKARLPSELQKFHWAKAGQRLDLKNYAGLH